MEDHKNSGYISSLWHALFASLVHIFSRLFHFDQTRPEPNDINHDHQTTSSSPPPPPTHPGPSLSSHPQQQESDQIQRPPSPAQQAHDSSAIDASDQEEDNYSYQDTDDETMVEFRGRANGRGGGRRGGGQKRGGSRYHDPSTQTNNGDRHSFSSGGGGPLRPKGNQGSATPSTFQSKPQTQSHAATASASIGQGDTTNAEPRHSSSSRSNGSRRSGRGRGRSHNYGGSQYNADEKENQTPKHHGDGGAALPTSAKSPAAVSNATPYSGPGDKTQGSDKTSAPLTPTDNTHVPAPEGSIEGIRDAIQKLAVEATPVPPAPVSAAATLSENQKQAASANFSTTSTVIPPTPAVKMPTPVVIALPLGVGGPKPDDGPQPVVLPGLIEPQTDEERAEREYHLKFMREALDMGQLALDTNETPVGCVLVYHGRIIAKGMNATNITRNGTRHAEFMALSALLSRDEGDEVQDIDCIPLDHASWGDVDPKDGHIFPYGQKLHPTPAVDQKIISECILYVTVEPCVMCASLLRQLGIKKVYFGAVNDKFGGTGGVFRIHMNSKPVPKPHDRPYQNGYGPQDAKKITKGRATVMPRTEDDGDGGNVERGYPVEGGYLRDDAVSLLRRFYVQENGRAPQPRKKEGRAARLYAMEAQAKGELPAGSPDGRLSPSGSATPPLPTYTASTATVTDNEKQKTDDSSVSDDNHDPAKKPDLIQL